MPRKKKAGTFEFEVLEEEKASKELAELRSGRGGRVSKYHPILEKVRDLGKNQALKVTLSKNEVGGLRGYLSRHAGESYVVKSSKVDSGEEYRAFVFHAKGG